MSEGGVTDKRTSIKPTNAQLLEMQEGRLPYAPSSHDACPIQVARSPSLDCSASQSGFTTCTGLSLGSSGTGTDVTGRCHGDWFWRKCLNEGRTELFSNELHGLQNPEIVWWARGGVSLGRSSSSLGSSRSTRTAMTRQDLLVAGPVARRKRVLNETE